MGVVGSTKQIFFKTIYFNPFRESGPINGSFFLKNRPNLLKSISLWYILKAKSVFDLHETSWIDQKQSNFVISGKFITKNYTSDCVLLWLFEIDPYVGQFSRKGGCSRKGLTISFMRFVETTTVIHWPHQPFLRNNTFQKLYVNLCKHSEFFNLVNSIIWILVQTW